GRTPRSPARGPSWGGLLRPGGEPASPARLTSDPPAIAGLHESLGEMPPNPESGVPKSRCAQVGETSGRARCPDPGAQNIVCAGSPADLVFFLAAQKIVGLETLVDALPNRHSAEHDSHSAHTRGSEIAIERFLERVQNAAEREAELRSP